MLQTGFNMVLALFMKQLTFPCVLSMKTLAIVRDWPTSLLSARLLSAHLIVQVK